MDKLIFSLAIILSGLALGYMLQLLDREQIFVLPLPVADLRKILQKIGLLFFFPVIFLAAVWIVSFENLRVIFLPVIGVVAAPLPFVSPPTVSSWIEVKTAFVPPGKPSPTTKLPLTLISRLFSSFNIAPLFTVIVTADGTVNVDITR